MFLKPGVRLHNLTPQMILAAIIVSQVFDSIPKEAVITSGSDEHAGPLTLHDDGNALDFRTRDLARAQVQIIAAQIRLRLGELFDVVIEDTPPHIHVEYQPPPLPLLPVT